MRRRLNEEVYMTVLTGHTYLEEGIEKKGKRTLRASIALARLALCIRHPYHRFIALFAARVRQHEVLRYQGDEAQNVSAFWRR
jgi:hypothetical protein